MWCVQVTLEFIFQNPQHFLFTLIKKHPSNLLNQFYSQFQIKKNSLLVLIFLFNNILSSIKIYIFIGNTVSSLTILTLFFFSARADFFLVLVFKVFIYLSFCCFSFFFFFHFLPF